MDRGFLGVLGVEAIVCCLLALAKFGGGNRILKQVVWQKAWTRVGSRRTRRRRGDWNNGASGGGWMGWMGLMVVLFVGGGAGVGVFVGGGSRSEKVDTAFQGLAGKQRIKLQRLALLRFDQLKMDDGQLVLG